MSLFCCHQSRAKSWQPARRLQPSLVTRSIVTPGAACGRGSSPLPSSIALGPSRRGCSSGCGGIKPQPGRVFLRPALEVSRRSRHGGGESASSGERDSAAPSFGARSRASERGQLGRADAVDPTAPVLGMTLSCIWRGRKRNAGGEKQDPYGQVVPAKTRIRLFAQGDVSISPKIRRPEQGAGETPCEGQGGQAKAVPPGSFPALGVFLQARSSHSS